MKVSTIYQKSIRLPEENETFILKPGSNNKKLGFKVNSKRWKGKKLYSLTLVERETCPTSCHHWNDCYGNNMPFAHRFSIENLTDKLETEIAALIKSKLDRAEFAKSLITFGTNLREVAGQWESVAEESSDE